MRGFGTVATGTLVGGELALGDELEALPGGRRARVRGLQVHGESVEKAPAGTRTAVNLGGVEVDELARGEVLAPAGDAACHLDARRRDHAPALGPAPGSTGPACESTWRAPRSSPGPGCWGASASSPGRPPWPSSGWRARWWPAAATA